MFDGPRMLVAAAVVATAATMLPITGAAAAEPLPAGTYEAEIDDVGEIRFRVFNDGSVDEIGKPVDADVYFKFDEEIRVLDEFHVVADTNYLVEVDVDDEDGTYEVTVSEDPDWVPHTVLLADETDGDDLDDDGGDDDGEPNGVAANKTEDQAPGQHGRDNADEKAGEHGAEGRANADERAGQGRPEAETDDADGETAGSPAGPERGNSGNGGNGGNGGGRK